MHQKAWLQHPIDEGGGGVQIRGVATITSEVIRRVRSYLSIVVPVCILQIFFHLRRLGESAVTWSLGAATLLDNPNQRIPPSLSLSILFRSFFHLRQLGGHAGGGAAALDNPDQRICDDVGAFCRSSTSIALALVKKVMNSVAFASEWGGGRRKRKGEDGRKGSRSVSPPPLPSHPRPSSHALPPLLPHSSGVLWSVSPMLVVMLFAYALVGTFATTGIFGKVQRQYMGSAWAVHVDNYGAVALYCATQMGPSYFILRCTLWSHPAGPIHTPPFPRTHAWPRPPPYQVLTNLYFRILALEGDLRFSLVRVREHAESIAFYRGDIQVWKGMGDV